MVRNAVNRRASTLCLLLAVFLAATGCTTNQAIGRTQLALISRGEANQIGEESKNEFLEAYGGEVDSPEVRQYVSDLGKALAAQVREDAVRQFDWEFFVVDSAVVNAFAIPGGKVYMSRGLLEKMDNTAQLAGVLGHEIGHVSAEHTRERMSQTMAVQMGAAAIAVGAQASDEDWMQILGVAAQGGGTLFLLKFSRDQESESDRLGLRYMTQIGYDPSEMVRVMEVLKAASGGGGGFDIFATHPNPDARIQQIERIVKDSGWSNQTWKTDADAFEQKVLKPLSKLPPAKHTGQEATAE